MTPLGCSCPYPQWSAHANTRPVKWMGKTKKLIQKWKWIFYEWENAFHWLCIWLCANYFPFLVGCALCSQRTFYHSFYCLQIHKNKFSYNIQAKANPQCYPIYIMVVITDDDCSDETRANMRRYNCNVALFRSRIFWVDDCINVCQLFFFAKLSGLYFGSSCAVCMTYDWLAASSTPLFDT